MGPIKEIDTVEEITNAPYRYRGFLDLKNSRVKEKKASSDGVSGDQICDYRSPEDLRKVLILFVTSD